MWCECYRHEGLRERREADEEYVREADLRARYGAEQTFEPLMRRPNTIDSIIYKVRNAWYLNGDFSKLDIDLLTNIGGTMCELCVGRSVHCSICFPPICFNSTVNSPSFIVSKDKFAILQLQYSCYQRCQDNSEH